MSLLGHAWSGSPSRSSARLIHFEPVEAAEAHQWLVGHRKQLCVGCGGVLELGPARHREGIAALPCQALVARNSLAAPLDAAKDAVGSRALAALLRELNFLLRRCS